MSKTNSSSTPTSPVSNLATNLQNNMNIKTPSPTQNPRKIIIKRRLNQICQQMSEIKLSPPPQQQQQQQQQQHQQQHQQQNIDDDELELFCQASTVKKGSKRAIEHPETLAPRNSFADKLLIIMLNSDVAIDN
ncbi:hypothetical protein TSAR_002757 [Trichomalopsis sarcophagae]|uniref:Uncharacterized protein n=1 Tax=Trichomalopsis sarcophagae TaxID=543379 RepID=A0A232ELD0_9HYME|nr:hypothetical protein TSAR_002757 [Trichomalopsis sarcophagae]